MGRGCRSPMTIGRAPSPRPPKVPCDPAERRMAAVAPRVHAGSMQGIHIAGTGMTSFGRQLDRSVRSLAEEAVRDALTDAGADPDDVGFVFFSNAVGGLITGQACVPGQAAL